MTGRGKMPPALLVPKTEPSSRPRPKRGLRQGRRGAEQGRGAPQGARLESRVVKCKAWPASSATRCVISWAAGGDG